MGTKISKHLDCYSGKEGIMYQITVKAGAANSDKFFSWLCVTEEELNKIVMAYLNFKLTGETQPLER